MQTKYTAISGQDPKNLPYDPKSSIQDQVEASVTSSLHNLRYSDDANDNNASYLDCLVLHSPLPTLALTMEAWSAMSKHVPTSVRTLGISNVTLPVLEALYERASVKPVVVQNRFHAATGYDVALRAFCTEHGITYQSFWTLTGNPSLLVARVVVDFARAVGVAREVALYSLVLSLGGISILNGTTTHAVSDLEDMQKVREWRETGDNVTTWHEYTTAFEQVINAH